VELRHDPRGLMRDRTLPAHRVAEDRVDLVLAPWHIPERELDRFRRLLAVELNLAAAIERHPVGDDGEAAVVGARLDPRANLHGSRSERDRWRDGERQRLPPGCRQHGRSDQSTNYEYLSHSSGPSLALE